MPYRNWIIILVLISNALTSNAQQDPVVSQYMFNPLTFNPSYAGINNVANVNLNSRFQWTSFEGSPTTYNLTASTSLVNGKVGLGVLLLNDNIGISNTSEVQMSYAYKISSTHYTFSFGLQTGYISYQKNFEDLNLSVADDPLFQPGSEKVNKFNVGAGISLMADNFFIGLSVPKLINSTGEEGVDIQTYERHFYLIGAYLFDFKPGLKMKPSVLVRGVAGAPPSVDLNVSFLINSQFWAGAFTRNFGTFGLMAQFDYLDAYKIGYSFEILGNSFIGGTLPTHEVMLSVDFALFNHQDVYKRFF
ncbi:MAG: type IX secretion system membrane protein PorP/SprF [Bacteroidota bacterium]